MNLALALVLTGSEVRDVSTWVRTLVIPLTHSAHPLAAYEHLARQLSARLAPLNLEARPPHVDDEEYLMHLYPTTDWADAARRLRDLVNVYAEEPAVDGFFDAQSDSSCAEFITSYIAYVAHDLEEKV